jgi:hypothetical protein
MRSLPRAGAAASLHWQVPSAGPRVDPGTSWHLRRGLGMASRSEGPGLQVGSIPAHPELSAWPRDHAGGRDALVRRLCALATPFVSMALSSVYKRKRCRLRVPKRRTEN